MYDGLALESVLFYHMRNKYAQFDEGKKNEGNKNN